MGGLASLQSLNLAGNQLTGELPPELDNLAFTLSSIRLDGNQLGGCISDLLRDYVGGYNSYGAIPICTPEDHPGDTEALIALHNAWGQPSINNWLSREPIREWEGVSVDANGRVAALNLAGQGLTGELPPELASLASLQLLNLGRNQLTGSSGKCVPNLGLSLPISILAPLGELCLTGGEFASVSAGPYHTCGVNRDGAVACWGNNNDGEARPPAGEFTSVSAGEAHTCGVKGDGAVACWGNDEFGRATPPAGEFTSVSAGYNHTCGVKGDGAVACWGDDDDGQARPPAGEFDSVSAGGGHTCGVKQDGSVECCGWDDDGQATPPAGEFASVSAGREHTCGVKGDGAVACWGSGYQAGG